ncbi:MAG: DUF429 domain-containing protein [Nitrospirae bacterium]|nr:DUF429 domain-containing protein [Nitrospirota bacterium]
MTAAFLSILQKIGRPIWPWQGLDNNGLLVEAFPAAQLLTWNMDYQGYNGNTLTARDIRSRILKALCSYAQLHIPDEFQLLLQESADALDAVLCVYSAVAVTENRLAYPPQYPVAVSEGWISVHRPFS